MAQFQLVPASSEWLLAVNAIVVGILLAGLALGIGQAMRSRRIWAWGVEELAQAIINAALLGALLSYVASVDTISYSFADAASACSTSALPQNYSNAPLQYSLCSLSTLQNSTSATISSLSALSYKLGYLSGLEISADVVNIRPFAQFGSLSSTYSQWAGDFALLLSSAFALSQFLSLLAQSAVQLFLPVGLLLRMFFATRKLGGAIMAATIGFYIVFPLAYSSLANPGAALGAADAAGSEISRTLSYMDAVPIVDLGKPGSVYSLLSSLSGGQLPAASTAPYPALASLRASLELSLLFYPLICLAITAVAIRELYLVLGSELNISLFEMI